MNASARLVCPDVWPSTASPFPSNSFNRLSVGARVAIGLLCLVSLLGCATDGSLVAGRPADVSHAGAGVLAARAEATADGFDLLYVTDRAPAAAEDGGLSYGAKRSKFMSFGSVSVAPVSAPSNGGGDGSTAPANAELRVGNITELGRFPTTPYPVEATPAGMRRAPQAVSDHEMAAASLQAEVARRLAAARRKEVVIFIHGYHNSFDDAALATGDICRLLQNEFVCVVLTWPAGGSGGVFQGYNIDRESGEFSVPDIKKAIRIISTTRGVERAHIIAHSRGTDVLATAIGQLGIEAYITRSSLSRRYNIANLVLFAPDIDINVASSKMFGPVSDPDLPFGTKASPSGLFPPQGSVHLTVYSSPNDRALGLSGFLFGSVMRLGQLAVEESPTGQGESEGLGDTSQTTGLGDFIEFEGNAGFIGHGYFLSNPTVGADLVALIRDRRKVGDPGRPLVEIKRPFWRLVDKQEQVRNSGQQL